MKTTLILILTGALLGVAAASWIVPPALSWYSSPGGLPNGAQIQAIVQIQEVINYSTSKLIRGQFIGGCVGAIFGLAIGLMMGSRRRQRARASAAAPEEPAVSTIPKS